MFPIYRHIIRLIIATIAAVAMTGVVRAQVETLDKVVAIVDDDIILASELRERLEGVKQGIERRGMEMPPEEVLIRETLDRLILESIQLQLADRYGVRIA
ncbi:MAG: molecular chaperone SurA, partial [Halieaceae bacterium]|nr:molecular chaperone SurA [Halieaceae bacterium]